jgi:hypothetical protein
VRRYLVRRDGVLVAGTRRHRFVDLRAGVGRHYYRVSAVDRRGSRSRWSAKVAVLKEPRLSAWETVDVRTPGAISVTAYGARPGDSGDDSKAFKAAIAAAAQNGTATSQAAVYVPQGQWVIRSVRVLSNVRVEIEAGSVLQIAPTAIGNETLFYLSSNANGGQSWASNVAVVGVDGRYTIDLTNAPSIRNHAFAVLNAKGFRIANVNLIQNDSNPTGPPTSYAAGITFRAYQSASTDSAWYHPTDGVLENATDFHAPFGFGLTQVTSGQNLRFYNLVSHGGITLRFETDGGAGLVDGVTATGIACQHGHAAVSFSPHDHENYDVHVSGVTATSCESGIRIGGDTHTGSGGHFYNSAVDGAVITAGSGAQLRYPASTGSSGWWTTGPSAACVSFDSTAQYAIDITNLACDGF